MRSKYWAIKVIPTVEIWTLSEKKMRSNEYYEWNVRIVNFSKEYLDHLSLFDTAAISTIYHKDLNSCYFCTESDYE